jgi:hypothetical protein
VFEELLFEHLLKTLLSSFGNGQLSKELACKIIWTTGRVAHNRIDPTSNWSYNHPRKIIYQFCSSLPRSDGWVDVVLQTLASLVTDVIYPTEDAHHIHGDANWVYKVLNSFPTAVEQDNQDGWDSRTIAGVSSLLNALLHYHAPPHKENIHVLLRALLIPGDTALTAASLLLRDDVVDWFQDDDEMWSILRKASFWSSLVQVAQQSTSVYPIGVFFIQMGFHLAERPDWHLHIREELCSWIEIYFQTEWDVAEKYNSVLSRVWHPETGGYEFSNNGEKALGLPYAILCQVWKEIDFSTPEGVNKSVPLLRSTILVALRQSYVDWKKDQGPVTYKITLNFKTTFLVPLRDSLIHAAVAAKKMSVSSLSASEELSSQDKTTLQCIGKILEDLINKMPIPAGPEEPDMGGQYWRNLQMQFDQDISALKSSLKGSVAKVEAP